MTAAVQPVPAESRRAWGPLIAGAGIALYGGWWLWSKLFFDGTAPGLLPLHLVWATTRIVMAPLGCFAGFTIIFVAALSGFRALKGYLLSGIALMGISAGLVGGIVYPYRRWTALDTLREDGEVYQLLGYSTGDSGELYLYACDSSGAWCRSAHRFEAAFDPSLRGASLIEGPAVQVCPEDSECGVLFEYEP